MDDSPSPGTDDGRTDGGRTEDYRTEDYRTDGGRTDDYRTDGGRTDDDYRTDGGRTDDDYRTDGGRTDDDRTDGGRTDERQRDDANEGMPAIETDAYLRRIGIDPAVVTVPDYQTLANLQHAHVHSVPFENLAIVGPPAPMTADEDVDGDPVEGVQLDTADLFEKIVERELGGYCFELNGLFHALLTAIGYDVDRAAACVLGPDGEVSTPANHHTNIVHLDEPVVVDVGTGTPQIRRPIPLDGTPVTDEIGVAWRVTESDRPDMRYRTEYREPTDDTWSTRYVFDTTPRTLSYFEASNDHLQSAPESPFTGYPIATIALDDGYRKLSDCTVETVTFADDPDEDYAEKLKTEYTLQEAALAEELTAEFGLDYATR